MPSHAKPLATALLVLLTLSAWADDPPSPAPSPSPESLGDPPPPAAPPSAPAEQQALESKLEALDEEAPALPPVPSRLSEPPIATAAPLPKDKDLLAMARKIPGGRYQVRRDGADELLTLDAPLQDQLTQIMRSYQTPYASVVAIEPSTGRVLAMAEHSEANPALRGLPLKAIFPAASIFKIVTTSALLGEGVAPEEEACFHGGKHRITPKLLEDSQRDERCYDLGTALAHSANVIFAKLTVRYLSAAKLRAHAEALRFNRPLPFPIPTDVSLASIPEDEFGLASAGAGFGDVYLSPLHGAALAAAVANRGVWQSPVLFERDVPSEPVGERVMSEAQAQTLTDMMEMTVTEGTARRIFRERGMRVPGAVGKTGSLADKRPFRDYSWFVGFAPRDNPQVAVAAVIVNDPKWRIRAPWLAREAMRLYLEQKSRQTAHAAAAGAPR